MSVASWLAPEPPRVRGPLPRRTRVLLLTEGTYPFVVGGVSTWCDRLLHGLDEVDWSLLAITAGDRVVEPVYALPEHVRDFRTIHLWNHRHRLPGGGKGRSDLAAALARAVLSWAAEPYDLLRELVWCRRNPAAVAASFRGRASWQLFLTASAQATAEHHPDTTPGVPLDLDAAVLLYQTLGWLARTAATPTPDADVDVASAAGWSSVPAVVDKVVSGRPMLLVEHGIYVRESYLAAIRSKDRASVRLVNTRVSRALARLAYRGADLIAPCTGAHRPWETALGADPARIVPVPNGVEVSPGDPSPPAGKTVVSVARIDPLKDIHTLLRVARRVSDLHPDAQFLQYGPVSPGQDRYADSCFDLHRELRLGERFRFMGHTDKPIDAIRDGNIAVLTSISEGFPMAVLEALGQGRPVVATAVGGVPTALKGSGFAVPVRDVTGLSSAVCTLLEDPALAVRLGSRGQQRVSQRFRLEDMLEAYRSLLQHLVGAPARPRTAG